MLEFERVAILRGVVAFATSHGLGVLCGAMTPTGIASARSVGARFLKLFPAAGCGKAGVPDCAILE